MRIRDAARIGEEREKRGLRGQNCEYRREKTRVVGRDKGRIGDGGIAVAIGAHRSAWSSHGGAVFVAMSALRDSRMNGGRRVVATASERQSGRNEKRDDS